MVQSQLFSSGIEVAAFVTSTGLLKRSWDVITSNHANIVSNVGVGISWKVYKEPDTDVTIVAFEVTQPADSSNLQADLVSSSELREKNFLHFEFLCTKSNPLFSLNRSALSLFFENHQRLDQLKSEISSSPLLIITGLALGGSIASLFTLSLLDSIDLKKKRPLCITFGSPLIGDKKLQEAISRSSTWNSCFLHVVSYKDPLPRKFITNNTAPASVLSPHSYRPFGTFLLCSDTYSTCFENPDSILALLKASFHDQNQVFQSVYYGFIVEQLNHRTVCKDFTARTEGINHSNIGYYDSYKIMHSQDVVKFQKNLTNYWKEMVEEAEKKPQKEGAAFRTRWLYAGTNYRRMVEPLDIAQYYREGGKDYVNKKRSNHFKQLEEWFIERTTTTSDHVEEALLENNFTNYWNELGNELFN